MRPPNRRPHRLSVHPQLDTRATSPTILGVLAVSPEPSVKMRALCITPCTYRLPSPPTHPADASAARRPSPHMAVEPQPDPGALAGAAAGPAGRAVETPYAAAAALSNAPGIGAGNPQAARCGAMAESQPAAIGGIKPNDPAAWGYAARSPTTGKIWRTTPPSRADTSAARPRFSMQIARQIRLGRR